MTPTTFLQQVVIHLDKMMKHYLPLLKKPEEVQEGQANMMREIAFKRGPGITAKGIAEVIAHDIASKGIEWMTSIPPSPASLLSSSGLVEEMAAGVSTSLKLTRREVPQDGETWVINYLGHVSGRAVL